MASQTDKKEEFRKYLEKGGVLSILTKALTDLFEMDAKPDDPVLYLYKKFGHNVKKESTALDSDAMIDIPQKIDAPQMQQAAQVLASFDPAAQPQSNIPPPVRTAPAPSPAAPLAPASLSSPAQTPISATPTSAQPQIPVSNTSAPTASAPPTSAPVPAPPLPPNSTATVQ